MWRVTERHKSRVESLLWTPATKAKNVNLTSPSLSLCLFLSLFLCLLIAPSLSFSLSLFLSLSFLLFPRILRDRQDQKGPKAAPAKGLLLPPPNQPRKKGRGKQSPPFPPPRRQAPPEKNAAGRGESAELDGAREVAAAAGAGAERLLESFRREQLRAAEIEFLMKIVSPFSFSSNAEAE